MSRAFSQWYTTQLSRVYPDLELIHNTYLPCQHLMMICISKRRKGAKPKVMTFSKALIVLIQEEGGTVGL